MVVLGSRIRRARLIAPALTLGIALALLAYLAPPARAVLEGRGSDPVVATGAQLGGVTGLAPERIVAFRWRAGWEQVPVQVDERAPVDLRKLYPFPASEHQFVYSDAPFVVDAYTDENTLAGADPVPAFDADDELALMAGDTGRRAAADEPPPAGVVPGATELTVNDPIDGAKSYVYLFGSQGTLDPGAGKQYVDYRFRLEPGLGEEDYLGAYDFKDGPNPESSTVKTRYYSTRSIDRWVDTGLKLTAGGAANVDILDRDKALFYPGYCGRSEDTFSGIDDQGAAAEEGSFIVNTSGPVRAIRSYIGANSGPYVNREHVYYERRQDISTTLRVHAIPNVMQFIDYSPEAAGMTYRNELNQAGVTVDGEPDTVNPGAPADAARGGFVWEQVSGAQGTVSIVTSMQTDIDDLTVTGYYLDENAPGGGAETQCTGDGFAYGSSGLWIDSPIPNTDPVAGAAARLVSNRSFFYDAPEAGGPGTAQRREEEVAKPLSVSSAPLVLKPAKLKLKAKAPAGKLVSSERVKVTMVIKNKGGEDARGLAVCVKGKKRALSGYGCERLDVLPGGESAKLSRKLKVKRRARSGKVKLKVVAKAAGVPTVKDQTRVKIV